MLCFSGRAKQKVWVGKGRFLRTQQRRVELVKGIKGWDSLKKWGTNAYPGEERAEATGPAALRTNLFTTAAAVAVTTTTASSTRHVFRQTE